MEERACGEIIRAVPFERNVASSSETVDSDIVFHMVNVILEVYVNFFGVA